MILVTKHELSALLTLILIIIGLSGIYFLQGAPFVAIIQIILHAGGILVLLICSLLFLKPIPEKANKNKIPYKKEMAVIFMVVRFVFYLGNKVRPFVQQFNLPGSDTPAGTLKRLGYQMLGPYGLVLELMSILLLLSLVSTVYIINQKPESKHE